MKKKVLKKENKKTASPPSLFDRIASILESARTGVARTVNTTQVIANWLVGRELVTEQQKGAKRADYGSRLLEDLASKLKNNFGQGYSVQNLRYMRQFYLEYPRLIPESSPRISFLGGIRHTACGELASSTEVEPAAANQTWKPGQLHPNLAWSLYRHLLKVESAASRAFYEIEAIKNNWAARELERQINSLLFERLAKSRDKKGLLKLATKGQEIATPADVFKDPVVIEFLGLPESPRLVESDLEQALIDNLSHFLLELGKGFAFVSRQERITLDGDNPTLGLVLCTAKNDAVVKYLLGPDQSNKIFASRYKLHLPTEAELVTELKREAKALR